MYAIYTRDAAADRWQYTDLASDMPEVRQIVSDIVQDDYHPRRVAIARVPEGARIWSSLDPTPATETWQIWLPATAVLAIQEAGFSE